MSLAVPPMRAAGCASDLELDELLAGDLAGQPKEAQLRSHLEGCARCRERLATFAAVEAPPAPAWVAPPSGARRPEIAWGAGARRGPRRRLVAGALALSAAAAIILFLRPAGQPPSGDERTKGGLALTVFVKRAGGAVEPVSREGELRAGDEMRFSIVSARPGYAVVLGLDAAPAVTVYVPSAPALAPIRIDGGTTAIPGSIVADETAGAERVVAVVCDAETSPVALRARAAAALAAAEGRPERVTSIGTGCVESSVVMRKVRGGR